MSDMNIVCLDLEGVLVPEIWIAFAEETGIPELKRTTRDEPDYDKLMNYRLNILKEHNLGLKEIQDTIAKIDPLPGAKEFLDELRSITQVIILSDTFTQFAAPLMKKLGWPTIMCNTLEVADNGEIVVALIDDGATVKRFYKENGHFRLQPENDNYEPIIVDELAVLGKVIALIRNYE